MKFKVGDKIVIDRPMANEYILALEEHGNLEMAGAVEQILTEGPVFLVRKLAGSWGGCFSTLHGTQHLVINSSAWGGDFPGGLFKSPTTFKREKIDGI